MVDVSGKEVTARRAIAAARYVTRPDVIALLRDDALPKADVLTTARLAGIGAAKRTSELIPLCHPLPLDAVSIDLELTDDAVLITATASTSGRTGVEMEALTAATVAGLTLHDMIKAVDPEGTLTDVRLLAKRGVTVAHCPTVFSRYGHTLEHFGSYLEAGVNMAIGTDTHPHNLWEEMRTAAILARVNAKDFRAVTTADMFNAVTTGPAKALGRDDIGRLAPGAKADIVLVDATHPIMRPLRDPLRSLVYSAADRAVREVYVDGQQLVRDGKVLTVDRDAAADTLQKVQADMLQAVSSRDRLGRSAEQVSPLSLARG